MVTRREAIEALGTGALGLGAGYGVVSPAWAAVRREMARGQWQARFFSAAEVETFRVLADLVIPRDERSGSATEAGVVEYADFVLSEAGESTQRAWRDGFAWLDAECGRRFAGRRFVACTGTEQGQVLDDIAFPARARAEHRAGAEWFVRVRDVVGAGFFSSRVGVEDLGYQGGVFNPGWRGAPPEAAAELGVSYEEWDRRYGGAR